MENKVMGTHKTTNSSFHLLIANEINIIHQCPMVPHYCHIPVKKVAAVHHKHGIIILNNDWH
jgi:hypothetical protein